MASSLIALLALLALYSLIPPVQSRLPSPENAMDMLKSEKDDQQQKKNTHAILCGVGWGILIPVSVITGKFFHPKDDLEWNFVQGFFLISGYAIGVAGWASGMKLGNESNDGVSLAVHRIIGIAIFTLASAQIFFGFLFSVWVRARMTESFWVRLGWYFFHGEVGAGVAVLSTVNVFKGLGGGDVCAALLDFVVNLVKMHET